MSIDFSVLVLGPCQEAFGKVATITPRASMPGAPSYDNRGIWAVKDVQIVTEDGTILSNRTITFGIRLSEYGVPPKQGDLITTKVGDLPIGFVQETMGPDTPIIFLVDDQKPDGQGGAVITVKRAS